MPKNTGTPKEGRFTHSKSLKTDSILETRALLHKLELMYRELHNMSPEELESIWPQTSTTKAPKSIKKTEKEFVVSMLMEAQNNMNTQQFFKKYEIDLSDARTRDIINQQVAVQTIGH